MNRIIFSAGFFAGSLWGAGVYFFVSSGKEKDSSENGANSEKYQRIFKYGAPTRSPDVSFYSSHALCYDQEKKIPKWVAEHITPSHLKGDANRKHSKFRFDPAIHEKFRSENSDFYKSGWSRGHMAPAGNYKLDQSSMDDTFFLSNILPQNYQNNAGFWNRFEIYCRDLTNSYSNVRIISGPVMIPQEEDDKHIIKYQLIGKKQIAVPTHMFKVVIAEGDSPEKPPLMGAFIVPNEPIGYNHVLKDYQVTLDEVESRTGLEMVPKLDRSKTQDLCTVEGCQIMDRNRFELYIIGRRLHNSTSLEKLEKVWQDIEKKNLEPDDYAIDLYNRKKREFQEKPEL